MSVGSATVVGRPAPANHGNENMNPDDDATGPDGTRGRFLSWTPSFRIPDYDSAVDHYVEWLGFELDWTWRAAPDQPVIMHVSRDGLSLFLSEAGDEPPRSLRASVSNLQALAAEWNESRPESVTVFLEQPYEIPTAYVRDPFGNTLALQQPQTEEEAAKRNADVERVRAHLRQRLDDLPPAETIADELGVSKGIAIEVLNEIRSEQPP